MLNIHWIPIKVDPKTNNYNLTDSLTILFKIIDLITANQIKQIDV